MTARPPAAASGRRPRRRAGRRHREAVAAGGVVLSGSDPPRGRTAACRGGRHRVAAGRLACQRAARVLRYATALRVTPHRPAARMAVVGLAARPGRGVPAVHDDSRTQRAGRIREGAADRGRRPGVAFGIDHGIVVVELPTYAVSSGVSFRCRQGVSLECRLTASPGRPCTRATASRSRRRRLDASAPRSLHAGPRQRLRRPPLRSGPAGDADRRSGILACTAGRSPAGLGSSRDPE